MPPPNTHTRLIIKSTDSKIKKKILGRIENQDLFHYVVSSQLLKVFVHRKPWSRQCHPLLRCLCLCEIGNWKGNGANPIPLLERNWELLDQIEHHATTQERVNRSARPWLCFVMGVPLKTFPLTVFLSIPFGPANLPLSWPFGTSSRTRPLTLIWIC